MSYLTNPYRYALAGYPDSILTDGDGTVNGATIVAGAKLGSYCVNFDGSWDPDIGDTIVIPDNSALDGASGLSVSTWINTDNWTNRRVIAKGSNSGWELLSEDVTNTARWRVKGANDVLYTVEGTTALVDGTWYHLVGRYAPDEGAGAEGLLTLYVDGVEEASYDHFSASGIKINTADVYLGATSNATQHFDGRLDDIGIFNYPISQATIDALYNSGTGATISSLSDYTGIVAYYSCEEFTGGGTTLPNDATPA